MINPQKGEQMLKEELLGSYSAEVENAVSDIIDKYNDVMSLKKVSGVGCRIWKNV